MYWWFSNQDLVFFTLSYFPPSLVLIHSEREVVQTKIRILSKRNMSAHYKGNGIGSPRLTFPYKLSYLKIHMSCHIICLRALLRITRRNRAWPVIHFLSSNISSILLYLLTFLTSSALLHIYIFILLFVWFFTLPRILVLQPHSYNW